MTTTTPRKPDQAPIDDDEVGPPYKVKAGTKAFGRRLMTNREWDSFRNHTPAELRAMRAMLPKSVR